MMKRRKSRLDQSEKVGRGLKRGNDETIMHDDVFPSQDEMWMLNIYWSQIDSFVCH